MTALECFTPRTAYNRYSVARLFGWKDVNINDMAVRHSVVSVFCGTNVQVDMEHGRGWDPGATMHLSSSQILKRRLRHVQ